MFSTLRVVICGDTSKYSKKDLWRTVCVPPKSPEKVEIESSKETSSEDYLEQQPKYLRFGQYDYNYWSDYSYGMDMAEHQATTITESSSETFKEQRDEREENVYEESLEEKETEKPEKGGEIICPVKKKVNVKKYF